MALQVALPGPKSALEERGKLRVPRLVEGTALHHPPQLHEERGEI